MSCITRRDSLKCSPVCETGHVFYQKFSSRPPSYICSQYRVDWKITKFIPDCSPVKKTATVGQVVLITITITLVVITMKTLSTITMVTMW